jgi:hypothetical protein
MQAAPDKFGKEGDYQCPPLLEKWQERIKPALDEQRERVKEWEKNRTYSRGQQNRDTSPGLVTTNLIYANQATIVPHVYSKNPEISVTPSKAVHPARYAVVRDFSRTLEIVLQRMFIVEARLKHRMRGSLYSVQNTGQAWLKMIYQRDLQTDPIIKNRIHDAQDNLARLERLIASTRDADSSKEAERERDEIRVMIGALEKQVEVVVSEGLVIDRILTDDILILDRTLIDFDAYSQSEAMDHMVWMTREEYEERFGMMPKEGGGPTIFHERTLKNPEAIQPTNKPGAAELVCVHEIWNMRTNTVFTFGEGAKQWAREPYQPERMAERWYPFFRMGWNIQDGTHEPIPDVTLQRDLQDEYNASRTQWAAVRKEARPVRVVRGNGSLTQEDVERIKNRKNNDIVVIEGKPGTPLQDDLGSIEGMQVDPAVYDTSPIRGDMELVAGRGDAAAGGIVEAKTATEAEIQQAGLMSRSDYRRDVTEDIIQEMATAAAEMLLQELTVQQVQFIAGERAQWPLMPKPEIFQLINIEIRAGSTGKPNQAKEREQWKELLPVLQQTVTQIFELQMTGNMQLASVMRTLLKETLRRYDERLDLEELLGPEDESGQATQMQMAQQQQTIMQLQQQLEQAMAQLEQIDQQKMQTEQQAAVDRQHERGLKEREYQDRAEERRMAREEAARKAQEQEAARSTEQQGKASMQREQWDREDTRAEADREFQREQAALQQQVEQLRTRIEQLGADPDNQAEMESLSALTSVVQQLSESLARDAEEKRRTREQVMSYLQSKKQDDD